MEGNDNASTRRTSSTLHNNGMLYNCSSAGLNSTPALLASDFRGCLLAGWLPIGFLVKDHHVLWDRTEEEE